jgi:hypothetical protein
MSDLNNKDNEVEPTPLAGDSTYEPELWNTFVQLNPATEPWFPATEMSFNFDYDCGFADVAFDSSQFWSPDFTTHQNSLPPLNYFPDLNSRQDGDTDDIANNIGSMREDLNRIAAEFLQVKSELEERVHQIAR